MKGYKILLIALITATMFTPQTHATEMISRSYDANCGHKRIWDLRFSPDGKFIVFSSDAQLLAADGNCDPDVYMYDVNSKTTSLVSRTIYGGAAGDSWHARISADSRYIVFETNSTGIIEPEPGNMGGIYQYDIINDSYMRISENESGVGIIGKQSDPDINNDGSLISFIANGWNLSLEKPLSSSNKLVLKRVNTGTYELVNKNIDGNAYYLNANGRVWQQDMSDDGRYIVYNYNSSITTGDFITNDVIDPTQSQVYLYDVANKTNTIVSKSLSGEVANRGAGGTSISSDGRFIVFYSTSTNLISDPLVDGTNVFTYILDRDSDQDGIYDEYNEFKSVGLELVAIPPTAFGGAVGGIASGNGRYLYLSRPNGVSQPYTGSTSDLFIYDRLSKTYEIINQTILGESGKTYAGSASATFDGAKIAFSAGGTMITEDDLWFSTDLFKMNYVKDQDSDTYENIYDCNDNDQLINPSATEIVGDGIDQNCNGMHDDGDADNDGYATHYDCNDNNSNINPNTSEIPYNGVDENCNGDSDDTDYDRDGYDISVDCNDNASNIRPSASEIPYNGIDENCNGSSDDTDYDSDGYNFTVDCNDNLYAVNPGASETYYNGIDENCNGMQDDDDIDNDGFGRVFGYYDCNDTDSSINPSALEIPYNSIDENCNGITDDDDIDRDGFIVANDCNDNDFSIKPGAQEIKFDGVDQDCNGYDLTIDAISIYKSKQDSLTVSAKSSYNESANLVVDGYGPMSFLLGKWQINIMPAGGNPGAVRITGMEGFDIVYVEVK